MSAAAFQTIEGVPTYNLFIGGEWVPSSRNEATASHNPATGEIYAKVHQAGARETEQAITAAHNAYRGWSEKVVSEREGIFLRAADVLAAKSKEIIDVLVQESGSVRQGGF
jgi:acyl-CoA reductase-like NAD-dependent aldehyde dehydrogenase